MSKSIRVSDKAYRQAEELRAAGYESLTNVIAVAIDRLHQAEIDRGKQMSLRSITVEYSADSVSGDVELTNAQLDDYAESLTNELQREYPDAEIEVTRSLNDRVDVDAGDDWKTYSRVGTEVQQILHEHWQSWIDKIAMQ